MPSMEENAPSMEQASSSSSSSPKNRKKLTLLPYVSMMYMVLCAGPYGGELLVSAAGPLMAILGFIFFPLVWSIPGALMTTELVSIFPANGGYVVWVTKAFGPLWGFLMGFWKLTYGIFYLATYIAIFANYLQAMFEALNGMPYFLLVLLSAMILSFLNYTGLSKVAYAAMAISIFSLLPFLILCLVAIPKIDPSRWLALGEAEVETDWNLYFTAFFWQLIFWDDISTLAGEAVDAPRTFKKAILIAGCLRLFTYLMPLLAITGSLPLNQEIWIDGYYGNAAERLAGTWLKFWLYYGGAVSVISVFQTRLSCASYQILGMASIGIVPKLFGKRLKCSDVPWVATTVAILTAFPIFYVNLSYVTMSLNVLQSAAFLLEFASFIWIRMRFPNIDRPFKVPMGTPGMVVISLFPTALLILVAYLQYASIDVYFVSIGLSIGASVLYFIIKIFESKSWLEFDDGSSTVLLLYQRCDS